MKTLGLIGFGQFGRLAARILAPHFDVLVSDQDDVTEAAQALGVKTGSIEEAAARQIVVVAVPVRAMEQTLARISPLLHAGALVIDVGSVKVAPIRWMLELLPPNVDIVATHPLFGPQSAKDGLEGLRLVVCPVRGDKHLKLVEFAEGLGLEVNLTTGEEHDQEMAYVQALTHLIGRSLATLKIPDEQLKTPSYQHLLELCRLIGDDSFELFTAIQTLNPYAAPVADAFVAQARDLLDKVHNPQ